MQHKDKAQKELYAKWLGQLDLHQSPGSEQQIEERRQQFRQRFQQEILNLPQKRRNLWVWIPAAAATLLLVTVTWLMIPKKPTPQVRNYLSATTQPGERKVITLSDGSEVTLNNSSQLKFPEVFTDSTREVFLAGEAFFNIKRNEKKPFIVRSAQLSIKVLGTSFNIKNYKEEPHIAVTVASGKVEVTPANRKQIWLLTPGQQLSYTRKTETANQKNVSAEDYTGWQIGKLIFKNESMESICNRLERWYGVKINIKKQSLKSKHINLELKNESLQNVLKMLALVAEFKYTIKDQNVLIW